MNDRTEDLQPLLDRLAQGDAQARDELIQRSQDRLHRLARKMLRCDPRVARWEQTDDVLQSALLRLYRALEKVKPDSVKAFIGLASRQMQRELIDLARHHYGPQGDARHHASDDGGGKEEERGRALREKPDTGDGPSTLAEWSNYHAKIQELPPEEREVFDCLYYQGFSQKETETYLGISEATVKRRWRSAKLNLARLLRGETPKI